MAEIIMTFVTKCSWTMAWSQLENLVSSWVLPIIPGRRHHHLLNSHGKPQTQFTEKLLGLWEQRNCSIYVNYLQISCGLWSEPNKNDLQIQKVCRVPCGGTSESVRECATWYSTRAGGWVRESEVKRETRGLYFWVVHTPATLLSNLALLFWRNFT